MRAESHWRDQQQRQEKRSSPGERQRHGHERDSEGRRAGEGTLAFFAGRKSLLDSIIPKSSLSTVVPLKKTFTPDYHEDEMASANATKVRTALLVRLEAKPGKEEAVAISAMAVACILGSVAAVSVTRRR